MKVELVNCDIWRLKKLFNFIHTFTSRTGAVTASEKARVRRPFSQPSSPCAGIPCFKCMSFPWILLFSQYYYYIFFILKILIYNIYNSCPYMVAFPPFFYLNFATLYKHLKILCAALPLSIQGCYLDFSGPGALGRGSWLRV